MQLTKKITIVVFTVSAAFIFCSLDIETGSGAPAGKTGSPGDGGHCGGCHTGSAVTTISGAITSDIPSTGYIPGSVYTITAVISDPAKNKFGFEISPQKTNGTKVGTMTITDAARTQLLSSGKYITHKSAGTAGTANSNTWSFQWTAPAAGTGSFTFYGAFLLANANSSTSGDVVQLSTLAVAEDLSSSVNENQAAEIKFYPNPAKNFLNVDFPSKTSCTVKIYSLKGEKIKEISFDENEKISADISQLSAGMYIAEIEAAGMKTARKFIKE